MEDGTESGERVSVLGHKRFEVTSQVNDEQGYLGPPVKRKDRVTPAQKEFLVGCM